MAEQSAAAADPDEAAAEELFNQACKLHAEGNLETAESSYRAALRLNPRHVDASHMLGVLLIQLYGDQKYEEGRLLVQAAINARPACAKFRQSLGVLYQTCGRNKEAVDALERANEKDPMNVKTLLHLARALRDVGRHLRAAEVFRSVLLLEPEHPRAHYQRASCLRAAGRTEEALAAMRQHLRLFPDDQQCRFWIAALSGDTGMQSMPAGLVAGLFDKYAERFDDHLVNQLQYKTPHLLMDAILQAASGCSASSSACCSSSVGPGSAAAAAAPDSPHTHTPSWPRAVDLGCGTGLMGPLLRPYVSGMLEGVDLSPAMVDKARERGCYDRLAVGELVAHIEQCCSQPGQGGGGRGQGGSQSTASGAEPNGTSCADHPPTSAAAEPSCAVARQQQPRPEALLAQSQSQCQYALLVAADVFVYIGNLEPVMNSAAQQSCSGALFAFSTEALEGRVESESSSDLASSAAARAQEQGQAHGYALTPSGRYVHSQHYLRRVAESSSWRVLHLSNTVIRCNAGKPVHGHLCVLQRKEW